MNHEDLNEMRIKLRAQHKQIALEQLEKNSGCIDIFLKRCKALGIDLNRSDISYVMPIGVVAKKQDILAKLSSSLRPDKEGLSFLDEIRNCTSMMEPGYFRTDNFIALAHPHFRRQMDEDANYAPRFLNEFFAYESTGNKKYIALDQNRVRINLDDSLYFEADTWFGAPFNLNVSEIPDGIVKLRPPLDLPEEVVDWVFHGAHSIDVGWSSREGIKIFQLMEFKTEQMTLQSSHPVRYIHAEFDLANKTFRHFDGAIQLLPEADYLARRDSDFNHFKKGLHLKAPSKKVYKINGSIEPNDFSNLCCHFLTANPLAYEYFFGQLPVHTKEAINRIRSRSET